MVTVVPTAVVSSTRASAVIEEPCANKGAMSDLAAGPRGDTAPHNDRWFVPALALTAIAALGVRITYVLIDRADKSVGGDAHYYHAGANLLAQGHGFIQPNAYALGQTVQAAEHPPMYLLFLSIPSFLGLTSTLTHLVW